MTDVVSLFFVETIDFWLFHIAYTSQKSYLIFLISIPVFSRAVQSDLNISVEHTVTTLLHNYINMSSAKYSNKWDRLYLQSQIV